jgi:hypothetical protein
MRRTVKISALILFYFLACGKSCDNQEKSDKYHEQIKISAETDSLRSAFGTDTLSNSSLLAYMETAKQKFYDFNDYLHIVADTNVARPFRDKAREMISNLFIAGTEPTKITNAFGLDSVGLKGAFQRINDSVYQGRLAYSFRTHQQPGKNIIISHETGTITVFLVKCDKNFGKEKFRVWNVFLGKME